MVWEVLCGLFSCYCWRLFACCLLKYVTERQEDKVLTFLIKILTASFVVSCDLAEQIILASELMLFISAPEFNSFEQCGLIILEFNRIF